MSGIFHEKEAPNVASLDNYPETFAYQVVSASAIESKGGSCCMKSVVSGVKF